MNLGERKNEIQLILGRDISKDRGKYNIKDLPKNIDSEVRKLGLENDQGLLAMLYLRFLTAASIPELKEYGGNQGWLNGCIE